MKPEQTRKAIIFINIYKTLTSVPSQRQGRNGRGAWRTAKYGKKMPKKGGSLAAPERAS